VRAEPIEHQLGVFSEVVISFETLVCPFDPEQFLVL
jgi:hypothetical protein